MIEPLGEATGTMAWDGRRAGDNVAASRAFCRPTASSPATPSGLFRIGVLACQSAGQREGVSGLKFDTCPPVRRPLDGARPVTIRLANEGSMNAPDPAAGPHVYVIPPAVPGEPPTGTGSEQSLAATTPPRSEDDGSPPTPAPLITQPISGQVVSFSESDTGLLLEERRHPPGAVPSSVQRHPS